MSLSISMAIADGETAASGVSEGKVTTLCRMPFWHTGGASARSGGNVASSTTSNSSSSLTHQFNHGHGHHSGGNFDGSARQQQHQTAASAGSSVSSVARSLLPKRRRLRLDPPTKLYFPCELSRVMGLGHIISFVLSFKKFPPFRRLLVD